MTKRIKDIENYSPFFYRTISKGALGINRDIIKKGWFFPSKSDSKLTSPIGTVWGPKNFRPLDKYNKNFQVVDTDYDNFLILYKCSPMSSDNLAAE